VATCSEIIGAHASVPTLHHLRYPLLHAEGRRLVSGWFDRAWEARECRAEDSFEPFIFTWFALNGWAACVSGVDQDRAYVRALACDRTMCDDFTRLLADSGGPFGQHATDFACLWPIFEVKELRRRGIMRFHRGDRDTVVNAYLAAGARKVDPPCWKRHSEADERVPLDWPHTLSALYRVRCNLFHGEKAAHSEIDQRVVSCAFRTLVYFFKGAGYLRPPY
jgi:hypothetical protein